MIIVSSMVNIIIDNGTGLNEESKKTIFVRLHLVGNRLYLESKPRSDSAYCTDIVINPENGKTYVVDNGYLNLMVVDHQSELG